MSDGTFGAALVTPESALYAGPCVAVMLRTSEGDLTVLEGHTPLVGDLVPSVLRLERPDGVTEGFCVHGGFVQVQTAAGAAVGLVDGASETERTTRVTLLCGVVERVTDLDVARAQTARERAIAAMAALSSRDDDEALQERETLERAIARAELRLESSQSPVLQ